MQYGGETAFKKQYEHLEMTVRGKKEKPEASNIFPPFIWKNKTHQHHL